MLAAIAAWPLSFTLAVAGAQGRLGRELVAQGLARDMDVVGLVRRPDDPILAPVRCGWLDESRTADAPPISSPRLRVRAYDESFVAYDALAIALSGRPFARDDSTATVRALFADLPPTCRRVCFVSAHGVGGSSDDPAIRAMEAWYLKDAYEAKRQQEGLVRSLTQDTLILRPRVLSHEPVPLNPISVARCDLAARILDWVEG